MISVPPIGTPVFEYRAQLPRWAGEFGAHSTNVVKQGEVAASAPGIPARPELLADALSLLVADAVWAAQRDDATDQDADLIAALDRWCAHPLVSRAAALVADTASFPEGQLQPLHLALIRSARCAWRVDPYRVELVDVLHKRAEFEHADDRGLVAAELFAVAIELCEQRLAAEGPATLSTLADLLGKLVTVLSEAEWGTAREQSELMARGAAAARRRLGILAQLSRSDRLRYRRPLADEHWAAVDFVTWTNGPAAGIDQSRRALLLYEEVADVVGSAMLRRLDLATCRHVERLERAGQAVQARRWRGRRTERLRGFAAAAHTLSHRDLATLIRQLSANELRTEAPEVAACAVLLAESEAADAEVAAVRRLAGAIIRHGECLYRDGRRAEAVLAWHRFLDVQRRLDGLSTDEAVVPAGCKEVITLVRRLGDLDAAVEFGDAAVDEWARLCVDDDRHLSALIDELRAQADRLKKAGRAADASEMAERAVARAHDLIALDPQTNRPQLSWALNCATRMHLHSWRTADADRRSAEALELIEQLADDEPDRYTRALASALHSRAIARNKLRDYPHARELLARATTQDEVLAADKTADRAFLANVLCTRAITLSRLRELDEALDCAMRAEAIYTGLAETKPGTYLPDLAYALNKVASIREDLGDDDGVRAVTRVLDMADCLADVGRIGAALAHTERALMMWEALAQENGAPSWDLGWSLWRRARWLAEEIADPACLALSQRAVEIMERTCGKGPGVSHHLAGTLVDHARHLARDGQHAQALESSSRALTMSETLADQKPRRHGPTLADCLRWHATHLANNGDHEAAIECAERALHLASDAAEYTPAHYLPDVAAISGELARLLSDSDAVRAGDLARRAIMLYTELAITEPEAFSRPLRRLEAELGGSPAPARPHLDR